MLGIAKSVKFLGISPIPYYCLAMRNQLPPPWFRRLGLRALATFCGTPLILSGAPLSGEPVLTSTPVSIGELGQAAFHHEANAVGLSASEWSGIRQAYEAGRHAIKPREAGGFTARNPKQGWQIDFDDRGFLVRPESEADWQWGLSLKSYGWGDTYIAIAPHIPESSVEEQKLTYSWDSVVDEWFINDQRGLEHGFTIKEKPSEVADQSLFLNLNIRGDLRPSVTNEGQDIHFLSEAGATVVDYCGLKVWDAEGRILPSSFEKTDKEILRLHIDDRQARYPITIDPIAQQSYLKASNTGEGDSFGRSVAIFGDTVVVGTSSEESGATGVDGDESDNSIFSAGAAYVFVRSGDAWQQQAYLKASNTGPDDFFGASLAISGDTIVVGAPGEDSSAAQINGNQSDNSAFEAGAAYVFVRSGSVWSQQAYLKASNAGIDDFFGTSVAISNDTVVVGARAESSASTGVSGDQSDDSVREAGAAYVFVRSGSTWSQQAYLKASNSDAQDWFGSSVAISGNTVVVGSPFEDSAAVGIGGDPGDNSAPDAGAAYVFVRIGDTWDQPIYLKASNTDADDYFGESVAVSADTVVIGAQNEDSGATGVNGNQSTNNFFGAGAAYVFVEDGGNWEQQAYLKASNTEGNDRFGKSVAISSDTVVIGARQERSAATGVNGDQNNDGFTSAGAAYVFVRSSGTIWNQQAYLKASNTEENDRFGEAVTISGDTAVVGAQLEDSETTGVDGAQNNNNASGAGAAYVFSGLGKKTPDGATKLRIAQVVGGIRNVGVAVIGGGERRMNFIVGEPISPGEDPDNNWAIDSGPENAVNLAIEGGTYTHNIGVRSGISDFGTSTAALLAVATGGVVNQLTFHTVGNPLDADPSRYLLYGITVPVPALTPGTMLDYNDMTLISGGVIDLPPSGRGSTTVRFENTVSYQYYALSFPDVRGPFKGRMRIAEVSFERSAPTWNSPAITRGPDGITLYATGVSGGFYKIQRSTDLSIDSWKTLFNATIVSGQTLTVTDPDPPAGKSFYRIVE